MQSLPKENQKETSNTFKCHSKRRNKKKLVIFKFAEQCPFWITSLKTLLLIFFLRLVVESPVQTWSEKSQFWIH